MRLSHSRSLRFLLPALLLALVFAGPGLLTPSTPAAAADAEPTADPTTEPEPVPFVPETITWGRCNQEMLRDLKLRCGRLRVPLDHDDPQGPTITLALSRLKHSSPAADYKGVMLTNPGGPGGAGRFMADYGRRVPFGAGREYDWIGIDPRGVGASRPRLVCDRGYHAPPRPSYLPVRGSGIDERRAWKRRAGNYAQDCGEAAASRLLEHVKTPDLVADLELIRMALGQERVSFYGYSYGGYLGQIYGMLHPERLDRVVLDSSVEPRLAWSEAFKEQSESIPSALWSGFAAFLGRNSGYFKVGRTRVEVAEQLERRLQGLARRNDPSIEASDVVDALFDAAYTPYSWPYLGRALKRLKLKGDPRPLRRVLRPQRGAAVDNGYAMFLATVCTDNEWGFFINRWEQQIRRSGIPTLAAFAYKDLWGLAPCQTWSAESGEPVSVNRDRLTFPALLVGSTEDGVTPFRWSKSIRERSGATTRLIAWRNSYFHGASLRGDACVDRAVARYLRAGRLPVKAKRGAIDLACPAGRPLAEYGWARTTEGRSSWPRIPDHPLLNRRQEIRLELLSSGL